MKGYLKMAAALVRFKDGSNFNPKFPSSRNLSKFKNFNNNDNSTHPKILHTKCKTTMNDAWWYGKKINF